MIINNNLEHRVKLKELMDGKTPEEFFANLPPELEPVVPPSPDIDCIMYALGTKEHLGNDVYDMCEEVEQGKEQPGDFVAYASMHGDIRHFGIYLGDNMVLSKWGAGGPVLRHPIDQVPSPWGLYVEFLRYRQPSAFDCLLSNETVSAESSSTS